jgi:hypothetical protein
MNALGCADATTLRKPFSRRGESGRRAAMSTGSTVTLPREAFDLRRCRRLLLVLSRCPSMTISSDGMRRISVDVSGWSATNIFLVFVLGLFARGSKCQAALARI